MQFSNANKNKVPQVTYSGTPYTQEQLDLGMFQMQKASFMRFIKKSPVQYSKIDRPMFFVVSTLITQGFISLTNGTLNFVKEL